MKHKQFDIFGFRTTEVFAKVNNKKFRINIYNRVSE